MKILTEKRCVIGEGPIWNEREEKLYFTNGFANEICSYDFKTEKLSVRSLPFGVSALAFDEQNRLIVSHCAGVDILNEDDSLTPIYDRSKYQIRYANDMKVGPDGAIYVGTQSEKRMKISDKADGKLYRISPKGEVETLLDGLSLSNGMEWSVDEKKFYHTDSDTWIIKEYDFDKNQGKIQFTGRQVRVEGVDGFTVGLDNKLYVGCWGRAWIEVVDAETLQIVDRISLLGKFSTVSCGFCGKNMDILAVTTENYRKNTERESETGSTVLLKINVTGRKPYVYKLR